LIGISGKDDYRDADVGLYLLHRLIKPGGKKQAGTHEECVSSSLFRLLSQLDNLRYAHPIRIQQDQESRAFFVSYI
jgi:hypothetical protein